MEPNHGWPVRSRVTRLDHWRTRVRPALDGRNSAVMLVLSKTVGLWKVRTKRTSFWSAIIFPDSASFGEGT
jgi:hypothetical protein